MAINGSSMPTSLPETVVPRTATGDGGPWHNPAPVGQASLFEAVRPTYRQWIRWLIRGDGKQLGTRVFGGDPEQARIAMVKVLEARNGRRFDVEWLDHIAEVYGDEGRAAIVAFVSERYGHEPGPKKPDPVRVQEELADVRRGLTGVRAAVEQLTKALEHIQGGLGK